MKLALKKLDGTEVSVLVSEVDTVGSLREKAGEFVCSYGAQVNIVVKEKVLDDDVLVQSFIDKEVSVVVFDATDAAIHWVNTIRGCFDEAHHHITLDGLDDLRRVDSLEFYEQKISVFDLGYLCALASHLETLTQLCLARNQINNKGTEVLVDALSRWPNLRILQLYDNEIGPEGAARLSQFFSSMIALETLQLVGNKLGPDGVANLAMNLHTLKHLKYLYLSRNAIGGSGAESLAQVLPRLTSLSYLCARFNQIGPNDQNRILEAAPSGCWVDV